MVREFTARIRLLLWAGAYVGFAITSLVLFVLGVVGLVLHIVWIGIPLLFGVIVTVRPIANIYRRHASRMLGREIGSPYGPNTASGMFGRQLALLKDPATARDMVWLMVNATMGLTLSLVALVEGILDLIFWWLPKGIAMRTHAHIDAWLLAPTDRTDLAQRVQELTESRAETVDTQAAELRRIERDLHDGAQARLVALGMNLGLAEELFATDPDAARALVAQSRADSSQALAELRDLVRGIHPPVLADRGLVGAVQALALAAPIPVDVDATIDGRLPAPVESAAYFAVAEALTNVVKHSGASTALITLGYRGSTLDIQVHDDGGGGADPTRGTGLRGIERRLSVFDGAIALSSPPGGPTKLTMVLPCASLSQKT